MNNALTRGILRLSKRGSKSGSVSSDSQSINSAVSENPNTPPDTNGSTGKDEWTKYDERLIDCINKSDISKLKDTLKKKGVSPSKVSRVGKTAIHIAVRKRCMEAVDLMLQEHPDLSCIDNQGCTVYHIAAQAGDTIMMKKLLDYSKWNLDKKDVKGMIALHYAVQSGDSQCVKLLLDNDSPVEIKDLEARTPLLLAVAEKRDKIATVLIEHGVNVNEQDKQGRSAMVVACSLGMTQIVSLLIAKGADRSVMNRKSINLDKMAIDDTQCENGLENGNGHLNGSLNGSLNGHLDGMNGETPVNGHNGHNDENGYSEMNGKKLDLSIDDSLPLENGHTGNDTDSPTVIVKNGSVENSTPNIPSIQISQPNSATQRRSVYNDDSLTSAIIESLMGFEGNCDTISENSLAEDQLQLCEKAEQEKKELKETLAHKDLRIEELQAELDSLKNKVSAEMELRHAAEKEVQQLKLDLETKSQRSECEAEQEQNYLSSERLTDEGLTTEEDRHIERKKQNGHHQSETEDDDEDTLNEDVGCDNANKYNSSKNVHIENDITYIEENGESGYEAGAFSDDHDSDTYLDRNGHIPDSDTDESISATTGYRKRSLGTAKQHINMLEERVLGLEEELVYKSEEIERLQYECMNAKELVDLNNNTTVPLEIHNELKSDSKKERIAYKEQIATLEDKVRLFKDSTELTVQVKKSVETEETECDVESKLCHEIETNKKLQKQINDLCNENNILKEQLDTSVNETGETDIDETTSKLQCDADGRAAELEEQVSTLQEKADKLQEQITTYDSTFEKTLSCYRNTLISLYQNNLDSELDEILSSVVKLRTS